MKRGCQHGALYRVRNLIEEGGVASVCPNGIGSDQGEATAGDSDGTERADRAKVPRL